MNELRAVRWNGAGAAAAVLLVLSGCGGADEGAGGSDPSGQLPADTESPNGPGANGAGSNDDGPSAEGPGSSATETNGEHPICPQCSAAGGETSDFGDERPLTPCELSAEANSIELAAAGALGFADTLAALEQSFDVPFEWDAGSPEPEPSATGYTRVTRVAGSTGVASVVHQVPSLAGCADWLDVSLDTTLATADGALSIAGALPAKVERGARVVAVSGRLSLADASGTLRIDPPPAEGGLSGYVRPQLYIWADQVRLTLAVGADLASEAGSDTPSYFYEPLFGVGPRDACDVDARPTTLAAVPIAGEPSLAERYAALTSALAAAQPLSARWSDGTATGVSADMGEPLALCDDGSRVYGRVAYRLQSEDGRVDVDVEGGLSLALSGSAAGSGWFNVNAADTPVPASDFATATGISGVDFQGYG
ncbi:MAG TPA: hypothetical protein VMG12_36765, partial [Polyangiaceae bacterium]|nr:hypothetical protein [Polyangiaceae bacterium]